MLNFGVKKYYEKLQSIKCMVSVLISKMDIKLCIIRDKLKEGHPFFSLFSVVQPTQILTFSKKKKKKKNVWSLG